MKIKVLEQVNVHWTDGRHFSAGSGTEAYVADDDKDGVALFQHLITSGDAEEIKEPETKKTAKTAAKADAE